MRQLSRRDFANRVVVAGTGLAAVTAAQGAEAPKRKKSKIRIGVRFNEAWLHSKNDEDLKFFKRIFDSKPNTMRCKCRFFQGELRDPANSWCHVCAHYSQFFP
jgi:hypothetical protein